MSEFLRALPVVLKAEGGYSDHPNDRGGATNKGITQRTYDEWRSNRGEGFRRVKDIAEEEVWAIYRERYWNPSGSENLPWPLCLLHFDSAVNHGVDRANRMLQKALGVTVDGVVGPITIAAAQNHANMAEAVTAYQWGRLDFYARIVQAKPSQSAFIVGWVARIRHLMESAA